MTSRICNSLSSLSTMVMKQRLAYLLHSIVTSCTLFCSRCSLGSCTLCSLASAPVNSLLSKILFFLELTMMLCTILSNASYLGEKSKKNTVSFINIIKYIITRLLNLPSYSLLVFSNLFFKSLSRCLLHSKLSLFSKLNLYYFIFYQHLLSLSLFYQLQVY